MWLTLLYVVLFGIGFSSGPLWPSIQNLCVNEIKADATTMFVLLPCIGIPGYGIFTWLMGILGDNLGQRQSFVLVPVCYLALTVLLLMSKKSAAGGKNNDFLIFS